MSLTEHQLDDAVEGHVLVVDDAPATVEAEVEAELQRVVPEQFSVNSPETAAWVVRRIISARRYAGHVKRWAEVERRRAEHEEARLLFMFGAQIRQWAEGAIEKLRGRRKSIALPGGTVGFRAVASRVVVRDEAVVMRWAKTACPSAIVVSERLLKTPLTEHVEKTGEVPEGVEITPPHDEFYIR